MERLKGKPVVVIGVNLDADVNKIKTKIQDEKINWRSIWDDPRRPGIFDAWGVEAIPGFAIVDPNGVLWAKFAGNDQLDTALDTYVNFLAAEKSKK